MTMNIKNVSNKIAKFTNTPIPAEGGKVFVNRLVHLFGLRSKVELSELIGVSTGSIATWQTRKMLPYELVIRIHLATGVSVEYLLFEELKGDLNVMQYLADPTTQPNYANIKMNISKFRYSLTSPAHYDGGAILIERLVSLFKVASKVELADLVGVNIGTLGTWHTRRTTPHELLCRIHLATGVSMHYLCFGKEWEDVVAIRNESGIEKHHSLYLTPTIILKMMIYGICNGRIRSLHKYFSTDADFFEIMGLPESGGKIIQASQKTYFIDENVNTVTSGEYLFSVNDIVQIGELKLLPDGKVYFIDEDEKYEVNPETTKVLGKVVSVLKKA